MIALRLRYDCLKVIFNQLELRFTSKQKDNLNTTTLRLILQQTAIQSRTISYLHRDSEEEKFVIIKNNNNV